MFYLKNNTLYIFNDKYCLWQEVFFIYGIPYFMVKRRKLEVASGYKGAAELLY